MTDKRLFIVFEGLDGAGTTTQTRRLHECFTSRGLGSFATFEPTGGPIGGLIRDMLVAQAPGNGGSRSRPPEAVLALLFAADRLDHSAEIRRRLRGGEHVVCDRYVYSSMAYQTLDPLIAGEHVVDLNRGCAVPDVTIFLSVPVETCLARIAGRGDGRTIYESGDLLRAIADNYQRLVPTYRRHFGEIVEIDGTMSPESVHAAALEAIERVDG